MSLQPTKNPEKQNSQGRKYVQLFSYTVTVALGASQLRKTCFPMYILNFKIQTLFICSKNMWGKLTVNSSNIFTSKRIKFQNFNIPLFSFSFSGISKQGSFQELCCFKRREFQSLDLILSQLLISEYQYVTLKISAVG